MKNTGFTFLEIVVSMLILGIVVAGTVGLFTTANKFIANQRRTNQAYNQASRILEQLRYYVSADQTGDIAFDVQNNLPTEHLLADIGLTGDLDIPDGSYTVAIDPDSGCYIVTASVSYEEL